MPYSLDINSETKLNATVTWKKGKIEKFSPDHLMVRNAGFYPIEETEKAADAAAKEANLLDALAYVGQENGMTGGELLNLFPAILRMLKSNSDWAK